MSNERGFTLVEMLVTVAVLTILLLATVPSFLALTARMRVEGTGGELAADLQYARSEAVRRRADVSLVSNADGLGYRVVSGAETLKTVAFAAGLTITAGVTVTFSELRAMANAASLALDVGSARLQVRTNVMGRVDMCSPDGTVGGYPSC
jgi:type IV fimbrial biogenesis protein FimT